jgi:hypothetical protein
MFYNGDNVVVELLYLKKGTVIMCGNLLKAIQLKYGEEGFLTKPTVCY